MRRIKDQIDDIIKETNSKMKSIRKRTNGERIREIRKREQKTQEQLVELLGIDTKTLSRVENGDAYLDADAAIKLYLEFGYSLDWIYGISETVKASDELLFHVDIRDIMKIDNGNLKIHIKSYLLDLLEYIEKCSSVKESEISKSELAYYGGVLRQEREFSYFNKKSYYCYSIDLNSLTKSQDECN